MYCDDCTSYCLSIKSSESTNFVVFQWSKERFNDSSNNFDGYKSENDGKYQTNTNMCCVTIDCILMFITSIIGTIYFYVSSD